MEPFADAGVERPAGARDETRVAPLAGLYALGLQVDPDLTPARFFAAARETGTALSHEVGGREYVYGTLPRPVRLMDRLVRERRAR